MEDLMKGVALKKVKKLQFPILAEVKHDEIRCHVILDETGDSVKFESYAHKPLHNLAKWAGAFATVMLDKGITELDCGVEVNGNFNDSYRYVRSSRGIPTNLSDASVVFHLYDIPEFGGMPYAVRLNRINWFNTVLRTTGLPIYHSDISLECWDMAEIEARYADVIAQGKEGLMLKYPQSKYVRGRSSSWIKMKPEEDADGLIVGIREAVSKDGELLGRAGSITLLVPATEDEPEHPADVGGFNHALAKDLFDNPDKYVGKQWVEFKYMMRDRAGGYRHPRFFRFREDK